MCFIIGYLISVRQPLNSSALKYFFVNFCCRYLQAGDVLYFSSAGMTSSLVMRILLWLFG